MHIFFLEMFSRKCYEALADGIVINVQYQHCNFIVKIYGLAS